VHTVRTAIKNTDSVFSVAINTLVTGKQSVEKSDGTQTTGPSKQTSAAKEPVTMIFAGDVMLTRGVAYMVDKYGAGDYNFPFLKINSILAAADIVFGNLEGAVSDKGYKAGSIYSFEADPKAVEGLVYAGFDVMSCANNHMLDYTAAALEDTLARLSAVGILCVGAGSNIQEALAPKFLDVKGNRIAFLALADFTVASWYATADTPGIAKATDENIKNGIDAARRGGADIVVVSFHFGNEYETIPSEEQKRLAHYAIDNGADVVVGHHPHVVQPVEEYKPGKWIAYSLGNFVFDQNFSAATMEGAMLEVLVKDGAIAEAAKKTVAINSRYQPELAE